MWQCKANNRGNMNSNNNNEISGDAGMVGLPPKQSESPDNGDHEGCDLPVHDHAVGKSSTSTPTPSFSSHCLASGRKLDRSDYSNEEPSNKRHQKMHSGDNEDCCLLPQKDETAPTLEPFVHQVTGRSHMLSLSSTTLCKSLLPQELLFYTSMPEDMHAHIPELKGVLYAQLEEPAHKNDHKFTVAQLFLKSDVTKKKNESIFEGPLTENDQERTGISVHVSKRSKTYKKVLFKGLERFEYRMTSGFSSHPWTIDKDAEAVTESMGANPWALRQHRREINQMLSRHATSGGQLPKDYTQEIQEAKADDLNIQSTHGKLLKGYLLLEDVTAGFIHPSVMDLKVGNQIERDDCSQAKKDKHLQLAQKSTTGTLLLRLAGMQVYQVDSGHYLCRDKYYGRGLSSSGFKENMKQFLHNGRRTVVEVIPSVIKHLRELHKALAKQDTFRFYASSLLILYEGAEFHTQMLSSVKSSTSTEEVLKEFGSTNGSEEPPRVIVRMIDFAHSTYKGFNGDKTRHDGPDQDCLQAIVNLIAILEAIATASATG